MNATAEDKPETIFELKGISKSFDGLQALENIALKTHHGERHAVIGPNGAGKTTLFNVIFGELDPDAGEIYLFNRMLNKRLTRQRVRLGVSRTYQITNLFQELTAEENILLVVNGSAKRALSLFRS